MKLVRFRKRRDCTYGDEKVIYEAGDQTQGDNGAVCQGLFQAGYFTSTPTDHLSDEIQNQYVEVFARRQLIAHNYEER